MAAASTQNRFLGWAKLAFRLVVLALVTGGIYRTAEKGLGEFRQRQSHLTQQIESLQRSLNDPAAQPPLSDEERTELERQLSELGRQRFSIWQIRVGWLAGAGVFYLLGSAPCWLFWHATLRAMGQRPRLRDSLRAYYIGHLGKYVPGKALVVILRSALVRGPQVNTTVAAASVFVETLTMMAVGALVASAILAARHRDDPRLLLLSLVLLLCAGLPTLPPVFRRLVRWFQVRRAAPEISEATRGLTYPFMLQGWVTIAVGWFVMGFSLWAVLRSLPTVSPELVRLDALPQLTAAVALALVAGFLSLLPGGVGVREYVVMALLAADYGEATAVISAILLRLVWLVSELLFSAILYAFVRPSTAHE